MATDPVDNSVPNLDFRIVFEAVPDPCLVLDPKFNILWGNRAFFEATMLTPQESLGYNLFDLFPENPYDPNANGVPRLKASLNSVLEQRRVDAGGLVKYDLPINPQKDAFEEHYWTPVSIPVFGADNEVTHILFQTKDVTQWVRQKLDAPQADLKRILDGIPDMAWMKDAEEKFIWVNRPFAEAAGTGVDNLVGKTDMDAWPPELAARYMADDAEVIRSRERKWVEEPFINSSGEENWIETVKTPAYDNEGEVIGTIGIARDITQRKRTEAALQSLNDDFTTLLNNTTDFIYLKDEQSRFRFCSQSLAELTGHKHWRDMIGKHDRDVFPEELAKVYMEEETVIFGQGQPVLDKTAPYLDLDGNVRWVNTNKWPIFNSDRSKVVGVFGISRDITGRKLAEMANQELEAFNYSVAHDLRKPLTVISGYARLIKGICAGQLPEECQNYLDDIYNSTLRMSKMIEALLNFANAARFQVRRRPVDMSVLAEEVAAELAFAEPARRVKFNIGDGVVADTDPDLMRVVLGNLLGNAWKYTSTRDEALIEFGADECDGKVVYFVRDNGVGFDPAEADKLFAPFCRLQQGEGIGGMGIGLATVDRIIKRHGGEVWAEGEPGKGATFYFTLGADTLPST
jgi:PAS domain S-box-containing protein